MAASRKPVASPWEWTFLASSLSARRVTWRLVPHDSVLANGCIELGLRFPESAARGLSRPPPPTKPCAISPGWPAAH